MQALVILTNLSKQLLSLMMDLIWLQVNLSMPGTNELLHFSSMSINSCLENKFHSFAVFKGFHLEHEYQLLTSEQN